MRVRASFSPEIVQACASERVKVDFKALCLTASPRLSFSAWVQRALTDITITIPACHSTHPAPEHLTDLTTQCPPARDTPRLTRAASDDTR